MNPQYAVDSAHSIFREASATDDLLCRQPDTQHCRTPDVPASRMNGTIELFADDKMNFRFRLKAPDGTVMAVSRPFPDKQAAVEGISEMREYAGMGLITDLCPKVSAGSAGPGGTPAHATCAQDLISVDDSGKFAYHRSEQDLIAALQFLDEAPCIMDRAGNSYRPGQGVDGCVVLQPGRGQVELYWLRQTWLDAQKVHADEHRLKRFYPDSLSLLLSDLFEALAVEHGTRTAADPWTLETAGVPSGWQNLPAR